MKFNHTAHKELWSWLVENPDKCKKDWPEWKSHKGYLSYKKKTILNYCFACDYGIDCGDSCIVCPIDLGEYQCNFSKSLYAKWDIAQTKKTKIKYAILIRDAAVKEGIECE